MGSKRAAPQQKTKKSPMKKQRTIYKKETKPELKAIDIALGVSDFTSGGTFELLNPMVKGDNNFNCQGKKAQLKSVHLRGFILPSNDTNANARNYLRMMLVYDKNPNGGVPSLFELLQDSNTAAGTTYLSHTNLTYSDRFVVLRDQHVGTRPYQPGATDAIEWPAEDNQYCVDWYVPLKGKEIALNNSNTGTVVDIIHGALWVVTINSNAGGSSATTLSYTSRVRFYDV